MNVDRDELDRWGRFAAGVRNDTIRANRLLAAGKTVDAHGILVRLQIDAAGALTALINAGAERPEFLGEEPILPLELMTSPANRRLYRALKAAWEVAVEVDMERGVHPHGSADFIADRLARVEREIYGLVGPGDG